MEEICQLIHSQHHSLIDKIKELENNYQREIAQLQEINESLKEKINQLENNLSEKKSEVEEYKSNQENYQKFSILQNFNRQINDKDLEIKAYQSKLKIANQKVHQLGFKLQQLEEEFRDAYQKSILYQEDDSQEEDNQEEDDSQEEDNQEEDDSQEEDNQEEDNQKEDNQKEDNQEEDNQKEDNQEEDNQKEDNQEEDNQEEDNQKEDNQEEDNQKEDNQEEDNQEEESESEDDIEYQAKKINKKYYYVSNEDPPRIYQCLKTENGNEIGDNVGYYVKNKPKFYKKKSECVYANSK